MTQIQLPTYSSIVRYQEPLNKQEAGFFALRGALILADKTIPHLLPVGTQRRRFFEEDLTRESI